MPSGSHVRRVIFRLTRPRCREPWPGPLPFMSARFTGAGSAARKNDRSVSTYSPAPIITRPPRSAVHACLLVTVSQRQLCCRVRLVCGGNSSRLCQAAEASGRPCWPMRSAASPLATSARWPGASPGHLASPGHHRRSAAFAAVLIVRPFVHASPGLFGWARIAAWPRPAQDGHRRPARRAGRLHDARAYR